MIYFRVMKMTSQPKWRHFLFFVYVFIPIIHRLFILWCSQCFQHIKANSFTHEALDLKKMCLSNSLQSKQIYNTKCVSIILYIYILSTLMYWIYAIFFLWMERKKESQLTKLCFEGKGSWVEHDKVNAEMTKITYFYGKKAHLVQTLTCIITKFISLSTYTRVE